MTGTADKLSARLVAALEESDKNRRIGRAERSIWLSEHEFNPGIVMGRMDTMALMQEARESFVDGHHIATLVLAIAFIEHTLVEYLISRDLAKPKINFQDVLKICFRKSLFPNDWIERTDKLRLYRNPFTHLKPVNDEHRFDTRYKNQRVHPTVILETDAKEALTLLYLFFQATLVEVQSVVSN